jgi:hypothetical protein
MENQNNNEFLERINKIAALFSLGREDVGEAIAIETLEWIRNTSNDLLQQAAVLLQLVVANRSQLTVSERENYSKQLLELLVDRFDEAILNPTLVHLIDSLDQVALSGVSQKFAEQSVDIVTSIMARRKSKPTTSLAYSPLEEVISLDDANIPVSFSTKLVSTSRILHSEIFKLPGQPDISKLIAELRDELNAANGISVNTRNILNGEINYLELLAGVKRLIPLTQVRLYVVS